VSKSYTKPLPVRNELNRPFWERARSGRLALQVCLHCDDVHFPPSPVCPRCLSDHQTWRDASGSATLESWVDVHRAYWPGFAPELPYRVCLVRLDEGVLMVSNLVGDTADAALGARLRVVFERATDEIDLPKFRLSSNLTAGRRDVASMRDAADLDEADGA
jgi:hypothetical protein